jgi:predicted Zn-dependent protease
MLAFTRTLAAALLASLAPAIGGCSTNPATGERTLALQSWEWERALAAEAGPQFTEEFGGETPDSGAQAYVDEVGAKLSATAVEQAFAEVPELEWEYTLLDSAVLNAFALPGGKVYISRGLAEKLSNEAQLAGVLGHEVGHVMARHGNQRISKQTLFNAGLALGAIAVGTADDESAFAQYGQYAIPALSVGGNVVLLSYGRDEELEADTLGIQYMVANGYNPAGQRQVMEVLRDAAGGGGAPPEWLSTHPASDTRINRIDDMLKGQYAYTQDNPEYQLYPDRYQQRMLARLRALPPAKQQQMPQASMQLDLNAPATWCAHCAAGASSVASR